jgi:hypothetical protein
MIRSRFVGASCICLATPTEALSSKKPMPVTIDCLIRCNSTCLPLLSVHVRSCNLLRFHLDFAIVHEAHHPDRARALESFCAQADASSQPHSLLFPASAGRANCGCEALVGGSTAECRFSPFEAHKNRHECSPTRMLFSARQHPRSEEGCAIKSCPFLSEDTEAQGLNFPLLFWPP